MTCALLVVLYVCTVFYLCLRRAMAATGQGAAADKVKYNQFPLENKLNFNLFLQVMRRDYLR